MAQFKTPSKKTTIITLVIIAVLLIIAATGTVMFLKDRGQTEASEIGLENREQNSEIQNGTTEQVTEGEQEAETQTEPEETVADTDAEVVEEAEQTTGVEEEQTAATGTTANRTDAGTGTTEATEEIQETTITRTETEERKVGEEYNIGWSPMSITAVLASADANAKADDIEIVKEAQTKTGDGLVQKGEEIIYTISIKNNSGKDLTQVEVKDKIPEYTTYVSSENGAVEVKEGDTVIGLIWNVDIKDGETVKVSFTVKVNDDAKGTISNVAIANGEESNPSETAIIDTNKEGVVTRDGVVVETANVGDTITYTITVSNTGSVDGKTVVKDTKLKDLIDNGILGANEADKTLINELMEGKEVLVKAGETINLTFRTTVLKIDGVIEN